MLYQFVIYRVLHNLAGVALAHWFEFNERSANKNQLITKNYIQIQIKQNNLTVKPTNETDNIQTNERIIKKNR